MMAILLLKEIIPTMTPCFVDVFRKIRRLFKTFWYECYATGRH